MNKTNTEELRIGIVGFGGNGCGMHSGYLYEGKVEGVRLAAVCDIDAERLKIAEEKFGTDVSLYSSHIELLAAKVVDAIIICTPHYDHPPIAIDALNAGIHVLTEKPAGVYTKQVREMNEAAELSGKVFGIMYNQRTSPAYIKMKEIVDSGQLGEIRRVLYEITTWYRTQSYFNRGGWRATWSGEGGGVLINQCPHNLDLWQWICGMPVKVNAQMGFGRFHDIEVEDDVSAIVEYKNGATGVFITTTGEAPGVQRMEIAGDKGLLIYENGKLTWKQTQASISEDLATSKEGLKKPECWHVDIPLAPSPQGPHQQITTNFINAIRNGEKSATLIAPGDEGIRGLELSNAMHLSAWKGESVALPIDEDEYFAFLQKKIKASTFVKDVEKNETMAFEGSY